MNTCKLCFSENDERAVVCAACGAEKSQQATGPFAWFERLPVLPILLVGGFIVGAFIAIIVRNGAIAGGITLILAIIALFLWGSIVNRLPKEEIWIKRTYSRW